MTAGRASAPLVAICTPVYNGEKYLAETMECVQAQTYPNLVHVIVDNASADATAEIISRYQGGRVPLKVSRNQSTIPMIENMNRAFCEMPAEARYFCLLCADDLILPRGVEKMVALLERDKEVGLVAAAEPDPMWQGWPQGEVFDGLKMTVAYFHHQLPTSFAHCIYRREYFDRRAPAFYDKNLNSADVDAALAVMSETKIGYIHEPQVVTREHPETATTREMLERKIHFPEWLVALDRYGAAALGEKGARDLGRRFKRHYFRRLLRWRFLDGRADLVESHLERLDLARARPTAFDYLDAVLDWPLKSVGLRSPWSLYPSW